MNPNSAIYKIFPRGYQNLRITKSGTYCITAVGAGNYRPCGKELYRGLQLPGAQISAKFKLLEEG